MCKDQARERMHKLRKWNEVILSCEGFHPVGYSQIRIASISHAGVARLRKTEDKIGVNLKVIERLAMGDCMAKTDREILRMYYRQYAQLLAEVREVIQSLEERIHAKQQAELLLGGK